MHMCTQDLLDFEPSRSKFLHSWKKFSHDKLYHDSCMSSKSSQCWLGRKFWAALRRNVWEVNIDEQFSVTRVESEHQIKTTNITTSAVGLLLLTLGTHAQRGLLYLVCVSVCVCVCVSVCLHLFSPNRDQAGSSVIPTALVQQGLEKLCGDFA